jgi:hypothetical protein
MVQLGRSALESAFMAYTARFGKNPCHRTYAAIAHDLRAHRESVGRIARKLDREGLNKHRRVPPGKRARGADYTTSHGTTENSPNYRQLRLPVPRFRGERTREAQRLRKAHALEPARRAFAPPDRRSAPPLPLIMNVAAAVTPPRPPPTTRPLHMPAEELDRALGLLPRAVDAELPSSQSRGPPDGGA